MKSEGTVDGGGVVCDEERKEDASDGGGELSKVDTFLHVRNSDREYSFSGKVKLNYESA